MYTSNRILFNYEGPTRGEIFVARNITRAAAAIELGFQQELYLGNLDAQCDRGHARTTMSSASGKLSGSRNPATI